MSNGTAARVLATQGVTTVGACADTLRENEMVDGYRVVRRGGRLLVGQDSQGRITTDFSYRNNGRGPDMREALQVNPQGEVMSYTVQGTSTFGAAIQESFSRQEGRLRWTSRIDRGDEAADNGTLFVPLESTPVYLAQLAHALLTRADRSAVVVGGARLTAETHGFVPSSTSSSCSSICEVNSVSNRSGNPFSKKSLTVRPVSVGRKRPSTFSTYFRS